MKITFVLPFADLSGGVRVVATYARLLQQRGHTVLVVSRPPRKVTLREWARKILLGKQPPEITRRSPSMLEREGANHLVIAKHRPIQASDVPDADVIIATWWETAEWIANFPPSKGAKVYFIQAREAYHFVPLDRLDATWRAPMHKIVIARCLAEMAEKQFGDSDYSLVPNSTDLKLFHADPREKNAIPTVGYMYSPLPHKGADIMGRAYELAREQIPELKLVSFGASQPTEGVPLPSEAAFTHRPPQEQMRHIYAAADAWLFGSRTEGFGLPISEAMACRTPVIGTPAGAAPELIEQGGGILVPLENPQAMAEAIVKIAKMPPDKWRQMSDRAYRTVANFTWSDAAAMFEAALVKARNKAEKTR